MEEQVESRVSGVAAAAALADSLRLLGAAHDALEVLRSQLPLVQNADLQPLAGRLSGLAREAAGLRAAVVAEASARGAVHDAGFADARAWLSAADPLISQADLGLTCRALVATEPPWLVGLREALVAGQVAPGDAITAVRTGQELAPVIAPPTGVSADGTPLTVAEIATRREALVADLVTLCRDGLGRKDLVAFKRHVLARYAPRREADAVVHDAACVTMTPFRLRVDGLYESQIVLDAAAKVVVQSALDALSAPRPATPRGTADDTEPADGTNLADDPNPIAGTGISLDGRSGPDAWALDTRTPGRRRADALVEICERTTADAVRGPMGATTRLLVTTSLAELTALVADGAPSVGTGDSGPEDVAAEPGLPTGTATTLDGTVVAPTVARLLTCDADLSRVTTSDGTPTGHVLDVGRTKRLATGRQRAALALRDRGCTFPGCDRPPGWCRVHHLVPWQDGGETTMANQALLCGRHHAYVHQHEITAHVDDAGAGPVTWHVVRTPRGWRPATPPRPAPSRTAA